MHGMSNIKSSKTNSVT